MLDLMSFEKFMELWLGNNAADQVLIDQVSQKQVKDKAEPVLRC